MKTQSQAKSHPKEFWHNGLRFECQQSGKCCTSHGEYGFVYVTKEDRKKMARHLKMTLKAFTEKHCVLEDGLYRLFERPNNPDCIFMKGKGCGIYPARPTQCRTWPFWPENLNAKTWNKEIATFCPGVGKGPLHNRQAIETVLKDQRKFESELGT